MKRWLLLILVSLFWNFINTYTQNIDEKIINSTFNVTADKVNPLDSKFPGGRGADELIVYTAEYGNTTGTNKYGLEAVVIDNRIQSVQGNNSEIPKNGFVISGHGSKLQWISKELFPGIEVFLEGRNLSFQVSSESKIFYADYLVSEVEGKLNSWKILHESVSLIDLVKLKSEIKVLKQNYNFSISESNGDDVKFSNAILNKSLELYYSSFPSYSNEVRASWFRIREKSPEELEETLKMMAEIGFNTICPETIYGGYAIYPNAHPYLEQHPNFIGWDPLKELVRLCKKYELKLVPWVWVFFVGSENSPLVKSKSDWLALSRQLEIPARNESNYNFFCPSRMDVHNFWLDIYSKLISSYDIDGLQLDYIRYAVSLPDEYGYCYCDTCRANFKLISNSDPLTITAKNNPNKWGEWIEYRKSQITSFVCSVANIIENKNPKVKLSADVFPLFEESITFKFQDWGNWLNKGYLDEIYTMSYTPEAEHVKYESEFLVNHLPEGIEGYVGLGPFMGFRPEILVKEIFYAQSAGADGVCLFSFGSLRPEQIQALKKGPFRKKASID